MLGPGATARKAKLPDMLYDREMGDLEVEVSELLVATADEADDLVDRRVPPVLKLLRDRMHMDVVFVSAFREGHRVFTHVEQPQEAPLLTVGAGDPLESSWCQRVVDGRLPELMPDAAPYIASGQAPEPGIPIGTHLSTPIVLSGGEVYGTLCCFSATVNPNVNADDLRKLRYTAKLVAWKMEREAGTTSAPPPTAH
jgi:hypothetical protein